MPESDLPGAASAGGSRPGATAQLLAAYARGERNFARWNLAGAGLHGATLRDCNFFGADFTGADLSDADLTHATFGYAKLVSASLRGANLSGTFFGHADLSGADTTDSVMDRTSPAAVPTAEQPRDKSSGLSIDNQISIESHICIHCHSAVPAGAKFCPACGQAQQPGPVWPTSAGASQSQSASQMAPAMPQSSSAPTGTPSGSARVSGAARSYATPTTVKKNENVALLVVALVADFITGAWNLIYKVALVILAIVVAVAFINSCTASATLNEHSSCQQFQQASTDAQNKVLQDMLTAHHDPDSVQGTRVLVTVYCNLEGPSAPIDGIYGN